LVIFWVDLTELIRILRAFKLAILVPVFPDAGRGPVYRCGLCPGLRRRSVN